MKPCRYTKTESLIREVPLGLETSHYIIFGASNVLGQPADTVSSRAESIDLCLRHATPAAANAAGIAATINVPKTCWWCEI